MTITKEESYVKIKELVDRFDSPYENYKQTDYNETLNRRDFIDPLFKALGWDVDNEEGYLQSYREVYHEDKIKVGKETKAPDYSFKLVGGKRLFFLDAKKPSIVIKDSVASAFQIRRYGWNGKMPISIVTDFEEFAIYDCTKKPSINDKASVARIKYITYKEYLTEFDFLWNTFSKEEVAKGSLVEFAKKNISKKGTDEVDVEFLNSLNIWRTELASNIAKNNFNLTEDELNFAVQQTIDRFIFLRIAEDRGVEDYGSLLNATKHGDYFKNLYTLFLEADDKYNSGLFDFEKDTISKIVKVDNKIIKTIISELYYPLSPYEFSILSVEILGSAYEQFLGKQIKIDKNHKATIEYKPAVRKAGGVYYTPEYIVEYIVGNTVGKLIEHKTPTEISKIKIVDPSCGSGSFLIGAYNYLLTWHKNYYTNNGKPSKGNKDNPLTPDGNLTANEKKRILINNIYGVDIDVNAVEVTKLSLLLKCMEGETVASINNQKKMFNERVLPTLDNNIKSGNSLIETDYYENELDFGEDKLVKPFSWKNEFPEVYKQGGYDAVIGNPPWVSLNGKFGNEILNSQATNYLLAKYDGNTYRPNLYEYFVHKGLELIKPTGVFSFIIPDRLGFNEQFISLRKKIITQFKIDELLYKAHFPGIVTDTLIFKFSHQIKNEKSFKFKVGEFGKKLQSKTSKNYSKKNEYQFSYESSNHTLKVITKMFNHNNIKPLAELIESKTGVILDTKQVTKTKTKAKQIKIAKGRSIGKYFFLENFFCEFNEKTIKGGTNDIKKLGVKEKVLLRKTGYPIISTYDDSGMYPEQSLYFLYNNKTTNSLKYFTALINSNVFQFIYINKLVTNKDSTPQLKKVDLDKFPVYVCNLKNKADKEKHDAIVKHVNTLLVLNEEIKTTKLETAKAQMQSRITYSLDKINEIVYELYDLTKEEIQLIEAK